MGETTTLPAGPVRAPHDEWLDRRWRLVGALLGLTVLLTAVLMVTTGVRPATYGDLLSDVASGTVDEVAVLGGDDPQAGDRVEVRWTVWAGVLDQYAEVEVGDSDGPRDTLRSLDRGLTITDGPQPSSTFFFAEWEVPGAVALLAMGTWLGTLLLLVGGPPPWRATRWAWAWAILLGGPLGAVAFVVLGGPLGVLRPRAGHRRITGGWAFLLSLLVFPDVWSTGV